MFKVVCRFYVLLILMLIRGCLMTRGIYDCDCDSDFNPYADVDVDVFLISVLDFVVFLEIFSTFSAVFFKKAYV